MCWRASRSLCDCEAYSHQSKVLKILLAAQRSEYYTSVVAENHSNIRSLFRVFSKLLHRCSEPKYPNHNTSASQEIRYDIDQIVHLDSATEDDTPDIDCQLNIFSSVSSSELLSIIGSTSFKPCHLDPVPGQVLNCKLPASFPAITKIVNLSLESGQMPELLKQAILKPLLRKPSLDPGEFKSFTPISTFILLPRLLRNVLPNS